MNRCAYCGRENEDALASCSGCGTPFVNEEGRPSRSLAQVLRTPAGTALSTGLAVLVFCGGLFFLVGGVAAELNSFRSTVPTDKSPAARTLVFSRWPAPVLALAGTAPIIALYRVRFAPKPRSNRLAGVTLCGVAALAAAPWIVPYGVLLWCPPVLLLLPVGVPACYAAASVQVLGCLFFLYGLRPRSTDGPPA
jgi:hypothetical protein